MHAPAISTTAAIHAIFNTCPPPLFALTESKTNFVVAIDLPSMKMEKAEITSSPDELTISARWPNEKDRTAVFKMCTDNHNIRRVYLNGVLWLLLPKNQPAAKLQELTTNSNYTLTALAMGF